MLIESDDVYAIYDGPCNRTECEDAPVSGQPVALMLAIYMYINTGLWYRFCHIS